jgi:REP element-mobilizing transposase RayT
MQYDSCFCVYEEKKCYGGMMEEGEKWKWQESGTSWKGIGIYHVTLTVTSREPLLGTLVIPNNDPTQARVERTELGQALLDCLRSLPVFHPEIQVLQYSLMPDHLHSIWYVRRPMEKSIRYVAQGFWRAAKKVGRAYSYLHCRLSGGATNENWMQAGATNENWMQAGATNENWMQAGATNENWMQAGATNENWMQAGATNENWMQAGATNENWMQAGATNENWMQAGALSLSSIASADSRENPLRQLLSAEAYSSLDPLFSEVPFIRPMSRSGQLQTMIRYVQLNPQRLATKRLMPGFFRVQEGITIGNRTYSGVGNVFLLQAASYATVHVGHELLDEAVRGNDQYLRNYMNGCVLAARRGTVLVSPFISPKEKEVQAVLLAEKHPFIILADNGFRNYYKPSDFIFDACASGRVLILSPWAYDANKRHISRADCMALNAMADEICNLMATVN